MIQALGISLVAMAAISVVIFELVIKGGIKTSMEKGHMTTIKGEPYETFLNIKFRGNGWINTGVSAFKVEAGQQIEIEGISEGKMKIRYPGKYAGRTDGVRLSIRLTDPLSLKERLQEIVRGDFVLDTLPMSLFATTIPKQRRVYGFGEQPTGYSGAGQELYGLEEYNTETDTKNIIWRRVAKSPNETLIASVREASVRDVVRVGVVQFAERGAGQGPWIDQLCEALGQIGREIIAMGPNVVITFNSPPRTEAGKEQVVDPASGLKFLRATDAINLTEAVMACSVATPTRDIREVIADSDLVVTGLKELEDYEMGMLISQRPLLIIPEEGFPSKKFTERSVLWSEGQSRLFLPMIQRIVES